MKGNKVLKLSILSISFLLMLRLTISPALAAIGAAVNKDATEMQMMVVVASMFAIPFGFVSGLVAGKVKTKTILYIGLVLYLIGGLGPMLMPNFTYMIVCRAVLGAGTGLMVPYAAGLIADFFSGEEFNMMIGLQSAITAVGNIITSILAGVLADIDWRLSFLIYGFAIVTFFLVALNVPEPPKVEKKASNEKKFNGKMLFICLAIMIYAVIYFAFFGFVAYVVQEVGGNASQSGLATMLMTVFSLISGLIYAKVIHILKKASLPLFLLLNVIGFYLLSQAGGLGMIIVGAAFVGLGFGLLMPFGTMRIINAAPESAGSFANGMFMTFVNVGTAISPALLALIGTAFGRKDDGQFIWFVASIVLAIGVAISIVFAFTGNKKKA